MATQTRPSLNVDDDRRPRRRAFARRAVVIFALLAVVELAVVVAVAGWVLLGARGQLQQAREDSAAGRAALADLDLAAAEQSFAAAQGGFADGASALRNPAVRVVRWLPVLGGNVATTEALAVSGGLVATAARDVLATVRQQPGGLQAFLPSDGRLPVGRLARLATAAERADRQLADAAATVDGAPADGLLGPVAGARATFVEQLGEARDLVGSVAVGSRALVTFMGGEGPKRYLVGAQNPAELRGTGGYIGAYAVATFDDGRFSLERFVPVQQLRSLPISEVPPPSQDFADRYNRFGGAGFWQAINATPDFPSAATAMVRLYEQTEDTDLDGVIAVDPFALEALVRLTGPVRIPGVGQVAADDVVRVVTNEAYSRIAGNAERKEVLGGVASTALRRLLDGGADVSAGELLEILAPLGDDRHLLLHSTDPAVQAAFRRLQMAGALPVPAATGDTVAVVVNNAAVNKVDFYVDRLVEQRVLLRRDGSAQVRLRVTFTNEAPASGPGAYVLGPELDSLESGDDLSLVSVYCGRCRVTGAKPKLGSDGPGSRTALDTELGHTVGTTLVRVPQGRRRSISLSWEIHDAWSPEGDGCYRSTYVAQPTIRGTTLQVTVTPPEGFRAQDAQLPDADGVSGTTDVHACYAA